MYHSTGVQKLSESQKSKLRNGHPVRIKQGSGNTLQLTDAQIKKLAQAHKKGTAYTIQMHPEQAYAKSGIQKLADKANSQVDKYTPEIEGEGIIGDALKGLIGMSGLGMKKKRGRPKKVGKGILSSITKAVGPAITQRITWRERKLRRKCCMHIFSGCDGVFNEKANPINNSLDLIIFAPAHRLALRCLF
jgi:hypothetical protein